MSNPELDFGYFVIEIRYKSLDYGPFGFKFRKGLPVGLTISGITLRSFLGHVEPGDDLSAEIETTSELIDAAKTNVSSSYIVSAYFNYPTTSEYIGGEKHTLIFELTLSNGATHAYYGYYVWVF